MNTNLLLTKVTTFFINKHKSQKTIAWFYQHNSINCYGKKYVYYYMHLRNRIKKLHRQNNGTIIWYYKNTLFDHLSGSQFV